MIDLVFNLVFYMPSHALQVACMCFDPLAADGDHAAKTRLVILGGIRLFCTRVNANFQLLDLFGRRVPHDR